MKFHLKKSKFKSDSKLPNLLMKLIINVIINKTNSLIWFVMIQLISVSQMLLLPLFLVETKSLSLVIKFNNPIKYQIANKDQEKKKPIKNQILFQV